MIAVAGLPGEVARHERHRHHADDDAEGREDRAQLVRANRVQGDAQAF